jgi:hypothetical protein
MNGTNVVINFAAAGDYTRHIICSIPDDSFIFQPLGNQHEIVSLVCIFSGISLIKGDFAELEDHTDCVQCP